MKRIIVFISVFSLLQTVVLSQKLSVEQLRCEYRENPYGLEVKHPRLGWSLVSLQSGVVQTAYRILVADDKSLLEKNMGPRLSIDETSLQEDLFTILSNKDGHGRRGTVIAAVRGTKASEVIRILMQIPQEKRIEVREVTMDFSDSMYSIVSAVFPNATIVIDCFHIIKRCGDAVEEIRLRSKREAIKDQRKYYRKKHPRRYKG